MKCVVSWARLSCAGRGSGQLCIMSSCRTVKSGHPLQGDLEATVVKHIAVTVYVR